MAIELESTIMREIGFGCHYNWYSGSGGCRIIREKATDLVQKIIQKHYDAGESISRPDKGLIATLKKVARIGDNSEFSLTKTWQAASDIIRAHIDHAGETESERIESYKLVKQEIERIYLPKEEEQKTIGLDGSIIENHYD
jgi:hypothetical protein